MCVLFKASSKMSKIAQHPICASMCKLSGQERTFPIPLLTRLPYTVGPQHVRGAPKGKTATFN